MSSIRNVLVSGFVGAVAGAAVTALIQQQPESSAMDPTPIAEAVSRAVGEAAARDREVLRHELSQLRIQAPASGPGRSAPGLESPPPAGADHEGPTAPAPPERARHALVRSAASGELPPADPEALVVLEGWRTDEDVRRRWMFLDEAEAIRMFGVPTRVSAAGGSQEDWTYTVRDAYGNRTGRVTLSFLRGRLTDALGL